jgi:hypothetical protein
MHTSHTTGVVTTSVVRICSMLGVDFLRRSFGLDVPDLALHLKVTIESAIILLLFYACRYF